MNLVAVVYRASYTSSAPLYTDNGKRLDEIRKIKNDFLSNTNSLLVGNLEDRKRDR